MDAGQQVDLTLGVRTAALALRSGVGVEHHVHTLASAINVALVLAERGAGREFQDEIIAAQTALVRTIAQPGIVEHPLAVTVGQDRAVDNGMCAALVRAWRAHGAPDLTAYEFPESLHLNHDIIDPEQAGGSPKLVYPVLEDLILH